MRGFIDKVSEDLTPKGMILFNVWVFVTPAGLFWVILDFLNRENSLASPTILFNALVLPALIFLSGIRNRKSKASSEIPELWIELVNILILSLMHFGSANVLTYLIFIRLNKGYPSLAQYIVIYLACFLVALFWQWGIVNRLLVKLRKIASPQEATSNIPESISKFKSDSEALFDLPHPNLVLDVSWSPNRDLLASSCMDRVIRIFELDREIHEISTIHYPSGAVFSNIAWSPTGRELATAGEVVSVWEPQSGNLIYSLDHHQVYPDFEKNLITPSTVTYSPEGELLASSFHTGSNITNYQAPILLWDLKTQKTLRSLDGH